MTNVCNRHVQRALTGEVGNFAEYDHLENVMRAYRNCLSTTACFYQLEIVDLVFNVLCCNIVVKCLSYSI